MRGTAAWNGIKQGWSSVGKSPSDVTLNEIEGEMAAANVGSTS